MPFTTGRPPRAGPRKQIIMDKTSDHERGLYRKYLVKRLDDRAGKHRYCEYYVLDLMHDKFAAPALDAYASACEVEYPQLAADLRAKAVAVRGRVHG